MKKFVRSVLSVTALVAALGGVALADAGVGADKNRETDRELTDRNRGTDHGGASNADRGSESKGGDHETKGVDHETKGGGGMSDAGPEVGASHGAAETRDTTPSREPTLKELSTLSKDTRSDVDKALTDNSAPSAKESSIDKTLKDHGIEVTRDADGKAKGARRGDVVVEGRSEQPTREKPAGDTGVVINSVIKDF